MIYCPIITPEFDLEEDLRIYGNKVYTYSIGFEGVTESGKCFSDVLSYASIQQSHSIEHLTTAYSEFVKVRQRKLTDLGDALALVVEGLASIVHKDQIDPNRLTPDTDEMKTKMGRLADILGLYGLWDSKYFAEDRRISYGNLQILQNDVQTAMDKEDNDFRQAMTSLEGLLRKRDNSFSTASKIIEKNNKSAQGTIRATGA